MKRHLGVVMEAAAVERKMEAEVEAPPKKVVVVEVGEEHLLEMVEVVEVVLEEHLMEVAEVVEMVLEEHLTEVAEVVVVPEEQVVAAVLEDLEAVLEVLVLCHLEELVPAISHRAAQCLYQPQVLAEV